jgi:hypothetical protein
MAAKSTISKGRIDQVKSEYLLEIRKAASQKILFLPHAIHQMSRVERMISARAVVQVIQKGEIIEDYPDDPRGHSCLLLGNDFEGSPIHIVCAVKVNYLAIITAYRPIKEEWSADYKVRILK